MDALAQAFQTEAKDVLEALEEALLALDEDPNDKERVDAAFRALHTLKGSGAMAGFSEIERFVHQLENAFDAVRSGSRVLDPGLLSITLASLDHLAALVDAGTAAPPALCEASDALLAKLSGAPAPAAAAPAGPPAPTGEIWGANGWWIEVAPEPELLSDGLDPVEALRGLERLGDLILWGVVDDPPRLEQLEPGHVCFRWRALLISEKDRAEVEEALFFLSDRSVMSVEPVGRDVRHDAVSALGDELRARLREGDRDGLRGLLTSTPAHAEPEPEPAPPAAEASGAAAPKKAPPAKEDVVKVPASKLDVLVDLVGEMVIAQARLAEIARRHDDEDLVSVAEDLERMCTEMRDSTMELRMLPIGTTFTRFKRLVRDVSHQLGKKIHLVTAGEDTELDKTVIDKLADPMVHLIRNSLDHGLESPEERVAQGKPETGNIWLSARHSDTSVVIEVRDDGKGLDAEKIRQKAIERGIVDPSDRLSEQEAQELIFAPGFSTAASVSALSGRGVGMDAVKSAVKALRGDIRVRSTVGEGTAISIELPLTLAIIEGLVVDVGRARYVLPLSQVEECIEVPRDAGGAFTELRGELVPFHHLGGWFGATEAAAEHPQIVVTHVDERRVGFVVDEVIGQQQTVIKSLGKAYKGIEGISGATIMGNGEVALILDPARLAEAIESSRGAAA